MNETAAPPARNADTRVFSTSLGHNNFTVADSRYLDFVARGLLWAVAREDAPIKKADK